MVNAQRPLARFKLANQINVNPLIAMEGLAGSCSGHGGGSASLLYRLPWAPGAREADFRAWGAVFVECLPGCEKAKAMPEKAVRLCRASH